jgi:hypothetical protein
VLGFIFIRIFTIALAIAECVACVSHPSPPVAVVLQSFRSQQCRAPVERWHGVCRMHSGGTCTDVLCCPFFFGWPSVLGSCFSTCSRTLSSVFELAAWVCGCIAPFMVLWRIPDGIGKGFADDIAEQGLFF